MRRSKFIRNSQMKRLNLLDTSQNLLNTSQNLLDTSQDL